MCSVLTIASLVLPHKITGSLVSNDQHVGYSNFEFDNLPQLVPFDQSCSPRILLVVAIMSALLERNLIHTFGSRKQGRVTTTKVAGLRSVDLPCHWLHAFMCRSLHRRELVQLVMH